MRTPGRAPAFREMGSTMSEKRRRSKQTVSFKDRLILWAQKVREDAADLRPGPEKELLLKKARQADTAAHLDDWVNSPGLQPPK